MTTLHVDAQTAERLRRLDGRVLICDEAGTPIRTCLLIDPESLVGEPDLPPEEWARRARETDTYTTAEVMDLLRRAGWR